METSYEILTLYSCLLSSTSAAPFSGYFWETASEG